MEEYKPFLMWDDSNKDGHAETIMDYVFSWCLRCTSSQYVKDHQPILYRYCMFLLCKLIEKENDIDKICIDRVIVKKQEQRIDLWVEIYLRVDNRKERHAILIEDKYYTSPRENQLADYKERFNEYYKDKPEYSLHYALITCIYDVNPYYATFQHEADANGFKLYHVYDLFDKSMGSKESESDIFNEFFIREWL